MLDPLIDTLLPSGVRARFVEDVNGLRMHVLEAGFGDPERPMLLLLHGFPELAYSWRKLLVPLAEAGYHVVAPDQRGYGRTTGWRGEYDVSLAPVGMLNLARDAVGLVHALGRRRIAAVIGHDFGSPVAAWCALLRPDVFASVVMMSAPFGGPPALPFDTDRRPPAPGPGFLDSLDAALAALPRPRKHYQAYYRGREADADMRLCPQGLTRFLRAYYHVKSADWPGNRPEPLASWSAEQMARLPTYYVMDLHKGMAATAAEHAPSAAEAAACAWLTEAELAVYAGEYARTTFQGGLNWYRAQRDPEIQAAQQLFGGRAIEVPAAFISGAQDWGVQQSPGVLERMNGAGCRDLRRLRLIEGAGHWVQQEKPAETLDAVLEFLKEARADA